MFKTVDGGVTWQQVFYDSTHSFKTSISFIDPFNGWMVGSGGLILHTTDGGTSWQQQFSSTQEQLQRVRFVDASRGWAVGLGAMIHTDDGGQTWTVDSVETQPYMFDVSFLVHGSVLHGWAVGFSGSVFKHESFAVGVEEPPISSVSSDFALLQNFPNPFNPGTEIRFELPVQSRVTISIFSMVGQEIRFLIDGEKPPGTYKIYWDGTNQSGGAVGSGMYFCRMIAKPGGGSPASVNVKKLLLLR